MAMSRYLSPAAARRLYNLIDRYEDTQAFYEEPALDILRLEGKFEQAQHVLEFGCGTGRLAESLLNGPLGKDARYAACDISPKMVTLTRARLEVFKSRVTIWQSGAIPDFAPAKPPLDRIVTSYVLDLLPPGQITVVISAARDALCAGGRFCAVSITSGRGFPAAIVSGLWGGLHRLSPALVGGCRPIHLSGLFTPPDWTLTHDSTCCAWGITSEILIARRN